MQAMSGSLSTMKIGIIDYGAGNLGSLRNAFAKLHQRAQCIKDPSEVDSCDKLILPGVGAFGDVRALIRRRGFDEAIMHYAASGRYILGVCLGMQLLFDKSYEFGEHHGFGLIAGEITRFNSAPRVPHIGWNQCFFTQEGANHALLRDINDGVFLYFVHSYHARLSDESIALGVCDYGNRFPAIVAKDNILGIQPHPEKSHNAGLQILQNFLLM
ncbi:imidazole glycerol phosphate synthase subunit HisH [Helicobacter sp.]|uniref:imidazole glycerol phosphate synthase subunit HisH n=1 Tax=Helicobacter sp. TaxID=218 RepID=UPI0025C5CE8C|nr:imidazole glycerol phosphate synthase subunit HisH [Helicobacter sp.]